MAEDVPPQDPNEKDPTTKKPDGTDPTNKNPVEGESQDDAPDKSDRNPPDDIRKDFLDEVSLAASVALAAKKSEYQPALLAAGLEADQVSLRGDHCGCAKPHQLHHGQENRHQDVDYHRKRLPRGLGRARGQGAFLGQTEIPPGQPAP